MKFLKLKSKKPSIRNFLRCYKYLMVIYGYLCFEYPARKFKISFFGISMVVINIFINIFQCYFMAFSSINVIMPTESPEKLFVLVMSGCHFSFYVVSLFNVIANFFLRNELFKLFKKLESFDDGIQKLRIKVRNLRDFSLVGTLTFIKYFVMFLYYLFFYIRTDKILTFCFLVLLNHGIFVPIEVFIAFIYMIYRRMKYIVEEIR